MLRMQGPLNYRPGHVQLFTGLALFARLASFALFDFDWSLAEKCPIEREGREAEFTSHGIRGQASSTEGLGNSKPLVLAFEMPVQSLKTPSAKIIVLGSAFNS